MSYVCFGRSLRVVWWSMLVFALSMAPRSAVLADDDGVADSPAAAGIVGDWLVASRDAIIHIERAGDQYQGYIRWQLHDRYGPEDGPALDGKIVTDRNNPNPALRQQPLTGLRLLTGLRYDGSSNKWTGGRVYNSDNGKTYNCQVKLLSHDRLQLRGYIGISLFGGNTVWNRVAMKDPSQNGLPYVVQASDK